jgi:5,10-methylenetetrahydromethanopterin reductase
MMKLSISIGISPRESLQDWGNFSKTLEDEGVDRVWLIDSQLAMKDVYVGLAIAALNTERLELGTGVTNLITRHPTVTANSISAIAELSKGRAILGLGAGDSAVFGIGKTPSKVLEIENALRFFQAVFQGKESTWEGKPFHLAHKTIPIRIFLAVSQERMCKLAGKVADGVIIMGPAQVDMLERQVGWIVEGIKEANRSRSDVEINFVAATSIASDDAAINDVRSWATDQAKLLADVSDLPESLIPYRDEFIAAKNSYDYSEHLSTRANHRNVVSDDLVRTLAIAGTTDQCITRLRSLLSTGIDEIIFPLMGAGRIERLRSLRDIILAAIAE